MVATKFNLKGKTMKIFRVIVCLTLGLGIASAACVCKCVNGNVEAVCESAMDLKPICSPRICPLPSPSIAPLKMPSIPPIGTSQCRQERVYNQMLGIYEWREVCR